jgi:hypothetical protein
MCGQDNAPWCVWVLGRDYVGEVFQAIWCRVLESVLFYVPIELAEGRNDVISNKGVVFSVGWTPINGFSNQAQIVYVPGLGIKIFWRWE